MPLLVGRHINKIDRKGRVSVPKPFRDFLQAEQGGFPGFYAYPLFTEPGIEGCGEKFMAQMTDSVEGMLKFSQTQNDMATALLESAHILNFDPEGRVVIPAELIEAAKLDADALFVGRGRHFQIWNPEVYAQQRSNVFERLRTHGTTLELRRPTEEGR